MPQHEFFNTIFLLLQLFELMKQKRCTIRRCFQPKIQPCSQKFDGIPSPSPTTYVLDFAKTDQAAVSIFLGLKEAMNSPGSQTLTLDIQGRKRYRYDMIFSPIWDIISYLLSQNFT